jgi:hypothetical protein
VKLQPRVPLRRHHMVYFAALFGTAPAGRTTSNDSRIVSGLALPFFLRSLNGSR